VSNKTVKKLGLLSAVVIALAFAGAVGAAVRYTVFTIQTNQYAHLNGTTVNCKNALAQSKRSNHAFLCAVYDPPNARVANSYSAIVSPSGVSAVHWSKSGQFKIIRNFNNP
jgi:hypothetical protein